MFRHGRDVELLKRQYLQLLEPDQLTLPPAVLLRRPEVQADMYETMFRKGCLPYPPPDRYRLRVLKTIVKRLEESVVEPDEDVRSPCLEHPCSVRPNNLSLRSIAFEILICAHPHG